MTFHYTSGVDHLKSFWRGFKQHHASSATQFKAENEHQNFTSLLDINAKKSTSLFHASSERDYPWGARNRSSVPPCSVNTA